jgi:uncharacterized protein VirK/YbjX
MTLGYTNDAIGEIPAHSGKGSFLGPLLVLARQKRTWSPVLVAGILWRTLTNIRTHHRVIRLLKLPPFSNILAGNPRFAFKYLAPNYLARSFSLIERAACFLHHHQRLHAAFPDRLLLRLLVDDLTVHELGDETTRIRLTLSLSRLCDKEGELSLNLEVDGTTIYVLAFSLIPGWVVKSTASEVVLLSRIQGTPGCYPQIKHASALLQRISLNVLLFSALQGVASAFAIDEVAAVSGENQSSYSEEFEKNFTRSYDDFYSEIGMTRSPSGFFVSRIPIEEKSLELVSRNHKQRTKAQREIKRAMQEACFRFIQCVRDTPFELSGATSGPSVPGNSSTASAATHSA